MIRKIEPTDIGRITELYYSNIKESFFSMFGKDFLRLVLEAMLTCEFTIGYVLELNRNVEGFIIGTTDTPKLFRNVLYKKWSKLLLNVFVVLRKPAIFKQVLDSFNYSDKTHIEDTEAELLFIAIESGYRNKDFGKMLINRALQEIKNRGIEKVKVSTLNSNEVVNKMLENFGVKLEKEFKFYGKKMKLYTLELKYPTPAFNSEA